MVFLLKSELGKAVSQRLKRVIDTRYGGKWTVFAREIGVADATMQHWLSGKSLPGSAHLVTLQEKAGISPNWLLTGQEEEAVRACPPPGHCLIRLPLGDPRQVTGEEAERLEKALAVLRGDGEAKHYSISLKQNIDSFHKGVLTEQRLAAQASGPGQGKNAG